MVSEARAQKRRAKKAAKKAEAKAKKAAHDKRMAEQEEAARERGARAEGPLSMYLEALPFEVETFKPEGGDEYDPVNRHHVKGDDCTILASNPRAEAVGFKGEVAWVSMSHAKLGVRVYGYGRPETDEAIACALERMGVAALVTRKWNEARAAEESDSDGQET